MPLKQHSLPTGVCVSKDVLQGWLSVLQKAPSHLLLPPGLPSGDTLPTTLSFFLASPVLR